MSLVGKRFPSADLSIAHDWFSGSLPDLGTHARHGGHRSSAAGTARELRHDAAGQANNFSRLESDPVCAIQELALSYSFRPAVLHLCCGVKLDP